MYQAISKFITRFFGQIYECDPLAIIVLLIYLAVAVYVWLALYSLMLLYSYQMRGRQKTLSLERHDALLAMASTLFSLLWLLWLLLAVIFAPLWLPLWVLCTN
jgi:hypothetical protein